MVNQGMIQDTEPTELGLEYYLDAYRELSTCRPSGMGLAPIPFTAILQYCNLYKVDEVEEFIYLIRQMDNKVLSMNEKKSKDA